MTYFKAKMHQIGFLLELRPRPPKGAYSVPPEPLTEFKGPRYSQGKGEGRGGGGGREETTPPQFLNHFKHWQKSFWIMGIINIFELIIFNKIFFSEFITQVRLTSQNFFASGGL